MIDAVRFFMQKDVETMPTKNIRINFITTAGEAEAEIAKMNAEAESLAGDHEIKFSADDTDAQAALDDLINKARSLQDDLVNVKATVSDEDAKAALDDLTSEVEALKKDLVTIKIGADDEEAKLAVNDMVARLLSLQKAAVDIKIGATDPEAKAVIDDLLARMQVLQKSAVDLVIGANDTQAKAAIDDVTARMAALKTLFADLKINITDEGLTKVATELGILHADIAKANTEDVLNIHVDTAGLKTLLTDVGLVDRGLRTLPASGQNAGTGLGAAAKAAGGLAAGLKTIPPAANAAAASLNNTGRRGYWVWNLLKKELPLAGGMLGTIAVWHVAMDSIIEILAVWVPALTSLVTDLAAWGAAAYKTLRQVYIQMSDLHTVMAATNTTSLGPLRDNLLAMQNAIRPGIYELLGDAFTIMAHSSGTLNSAITKTMTYLDNLGSRIVATATKGGSGFNNFLNLGDKDMAEIGQFFDNLGHALGNFLKATPGFADAFLQIGVALSKLLALISDVPQPVLYFALVLHGLWMWGGLAATVIDKLGTGLLVMAGKIAPLSNNVIKLASAFKISDSNMVSLLSHSSVIQKYAQITGSSADDVAKFVQQNHLAADSVTDLAKAAGTTSPAIMKAAQAADDDAGKMSAMDRATQGAKSAFSGLVGWIASPEGLIAVAAVAAAAVAYLAYKMITAKDATAQWIAALNNKLADTSIMTVIPALGDALQQVNAKLIASKTQLASMPGALQGMSKALAPVAPALQGISSGTGIWERVTRGAIEAFSPLGAASGKYINSLTGQAGALGDVSKKTQELRAEQIQLYGEQSLAVSRVQDLAKTYGTNYVGALSLANLAGVKSSQLMSTSLSTWKQVQIQIQGVINGYKAMGQAGTNMKGPLGADMNVLAYASSSMLANVQKLNSAWDTFTQNVAAPRTSFINFAQSLTQFTSDAKTAGASMSGLGSGFQKASRPITTAALQLQSDFQSTYSDAETMLDSLRTAGAPVGVFTSVVKDLVASMIPMAGHSKAAAAEIYAIAEEANYKGSPSIKALTKWVGGIADPMKRMEDATNKTVLATSRLSVQAQKLSSTLQNDENAALVNNAAKFFHLQGLQETYLKDLSEYGPKSKKTIEALDAYNKGLAAASKVLDEAGNAQSRATGKTGKAAAAADRGGKAFRSFGIHVRGYTGEQDKANKAADKSAGASDKAKQHLGGLDGAILDVTKAWDWLWRVLTTKSIGDAISHAGGHEISNVFDGIRHEISHVFSGDVKHAVAHWFDDARHDVAVGGHHLAHSFDNVRQWVSSAWAAIWKGNAWKDVAHVFDLTNIVNTANLSKQTSHVFDVVRHGVIALADSIAQGTASDFDAVRHSVAGVGHDVATDFDTTRHKASSIWDGLWSQDIPSGLEHGLDAVGGGTTRLGHNVASGFDNARHGAASIWDGLWGSDVPSLLNSGTSFVKSHLSSFGSSVSGAFDSVKQGVTSTWGNMWKTGVQSPMTTSVMFLEQHLKGFGGNFTSMFSSLKSSLHSIWSDMWTGIESIISGAMTKIGNIVDKIKSAFSTPIDWVVNNVWDKLANLWNSIAGKLHLSALKLPVAHFSTGGVVPGGNGGGDHVPALLEPG